MGHPISPAQFPYFQIVFLLILGTKIMGFNGWVVTILPLLKSSCICIILQRNKNKEKFPFLFTWYQSQKGSLGLFPFSFSSTFVTDFHSSFDQIQLLCFSHPKTKHLSAATYHPLYQGKPDDKRWYGHQ